MYNKKFILFQRAGVSGRCAHVAAILLMLCNYIDENGYNIVEKPSTSMPCSWNKGKKREKTPKQLHNIECKLSKQQKPDNLYYWDPRPKEFQIKNNVEHFNSFICNLQCINNLNRGNKLSMWQTLFKITYKDFSLEEEDIDYYSSQVTIFETCLEGNISKVLKDHVSGQVPGTEEQSDISMVPAAFVLNYYIKVQNCYFLR